MRMLLEAPGWPDVVVTFSPATAPARAFSTVVGDCLSRSLFTVEMALVSSRRFCVL